MGFEEFLQNTPWWVYPIFFYLIFLGYYMRRPRVISIYRVFIIPVLLSAWSVHVLYTRYSMTFLHIGVWVLSVLLGSWAGWWTFYRKKLAVDKCQRLIRTPGGWTPLILIVLVFVIRYYFTLMHARYPPTMTSPPFVYSDLILTSFIIGLFIGRALRALRDFRKATHTDLHRF